MKITVTMVVKEIHYRVVRKRPWGLLLLKFEIHGRKLVSC